MASLDRVWRRSLELAAAFGLTTVLGAHTPNALTGASMLAGKPAVMVEIPSPRILTETLVACALRGTINVLSAAGVIADRVQPQTDFPIIPGDHRILPSLRATHGGVVRYEVTPGDFTPTGTVVARLYNVFGDEVEAIAMPTDGYVSTFPPLSWAGRLRDCVRRLRCRLLFLNRGMKKVGDGSSSGENLFRE